MQVNSKKILTAIIILVAAISQSRGQVTVGALTEPQTFSILELESGGERGLRLPQLITEERDELDLTSSPVAATGLTIFNLDTQCVETWNGTEWISQCAMCGDSPCIYYPPNPPTAEPNSGIDMYIGVMYDFQYQTIQSYSIGGTPESYQWYVKRKGEPDSKYRGLSGATGSSYTVPSNFIKDTFQPIISEKSNDYNDSIVFVCFAKFSGNTIKRTPEAGIEFIGTNTAGYGTDDGVKYLTLKKGTGNTIKVALLSLGQGTDTKDFTAQSFINSDAADLGDFYQWGRVGDGHEHAVWTKDAQNHRDTISPYGAQGGTSGYVPYGSPIPSYDSDSHQVLSSSTAYYGKVITAGNDVSQGNNDWYYSSGHDNALWGDGNNDRNHEYSTWTNSGNNPCPTNWKVPSTFKFFDILDGNGTNDLPNSQTEIEWKNIQSTNNNTWVWRDPANNSVGGVLISNAAGEKLFLPAAGWRSGGVLWEVNTSGRYWSSTRSGATENNSSFRLYFTNEFVQAGNAGNSKESAIMVRCFK